MKPLNLDEVREYVNENVVGFHQQRIKSLEELDLRELLTKNPYLFRAKNIMAAGELITSLLDAFLSSSEEKIFGDFLEGLALFVVQKTCNGHKSTAPGVDLEFFNRSVHYVVSIKSGPKWGNSSQQAKLEDDLKKAVARVKQSSRGANVQPVLGICYGKTKTRYVRGYLKVVGQNFWYLLSENKDLLLQRKITLLRKIAADREELGVTLIGESITGGHRRESKTQTPKSSRFAKAARQWTAARVPVDSPGCGHQRRRIAGFS